jgi:hypothetical protein
MSSTDCLAQLIFSQMLALFQLGKQEDCGTGIRSELESDKKSEKKCVFTRPESESYESSCCLICFSGLQQQSSNSRKPGKPDQVNSECEEFEPKDIEAEAATALDSKLPKDLQEDFEDKRVHNSKSISLSREAIEFLRVTSENIRRSNIINQGFGRNGNFGVRPIFVN